MDNKPILRYLIADYIDIGEEGAEDIQLMKTFESIDESPNAASVEKHYTGNKSMTTLTTGYNTSFSIQADRYTNEAVTEYLASIGEEQKLGVLTDYYRVNLWRAIELKENTFYARKFRVSPLIESLEGAGGEITSVSGTLNTVADVVIGEFNVTTGTFTANEDLV